MKNGKRFVSLVSAAVVAVLMSALVAPPTALAMEDDCQQVMQQLMFLHNERNQADDWYGTLIEWADDPNCNQDPECNPYNVDIQAELSDTAYEISALTFSISVTAELAHGMHCY